MARRTRVPPATAVAVTLHGEVPRRIQGYAARKIGHVARYSREPVLSAHVVLELAADPARQRPAIAEATLDVNGRPVRAKVAADRMREAIDLLEDRLRRRLVQIEDRVRTRHRWIATAETHEWRHGDVPTARPAYFPRPAEQRQIIRRKTFALHPMTPDEAAFTMDALGHEFFLFTDSATGRDALIHRLPGGRYGLRGRSGVQLPTPGSAGLVPEGPAPSLSAEQAVEHLDLGGDPFVFYLDRATGRGRVIYRRYDGNYGLITAT